MLKITQGGKEKEFLTSRLESTIIGIRIIALLVDNFMKSRVSPNCWSDQYIKA